MADAKTRARNILRALPLSQRQRDLYERGVAAMDEAALERTTNNLKSALSRVPETLAAARDLLAEQKAQSRKRAVIYFEGNTDPPDLIKIVSAELETETTNAPEEAIEMVGAKSPAVVICAFQMPRTKAVGLIGRMRRAASAPCTILVPTTSADEDAQVALAGATGYRAKELQQAITKAIQASDWLSNNS
jgi:hypothetical protein